MLSWYLSKLSHDIIIKVASKVRGKTAKVQADVLSEIGRATSNILGIEKIKIIPQRNKIRKKLTEREDWRCIKNYLLDAYNQDISLAAGLNLYMVVNLINSQVENCKDTGSEKLLWGLLFESQQSLKTLYQCCGC